MRLIRGTLVAIGVFRVFQFIEESLRKATETAIEFEQSLYRLQNIERILSKAGKEITFQGLRDGIKEIRELLPIFSEADITQQVSLIGIMTKELGYTEDQIIDLGKAIGVFNIRSAEQEDLLSTTQKILTALVAPTGKGTPSLGIDLGADAQEAEALSEGLLKAGESLNNLTKQEKNLVKLNLILNNAGEELININEYLDSNTAKLQQNAAAWEDFLRGVGESLLPFVPGLTTAFEKLQGVSVTVRQLMILAFSAIVGGAAAGKIAVAQLGEQFVLLGRLIIAITTGDILTIADVVTKASENFRNVLSGYGKGYETALRDLTDKFFPDLRDRTDEATASLEGLENALESVTEIEGFDKFIDDLTKLQQKLQETQEDFDIDQARAFEDYQIDIARIQEDFAIKRERVILDANQAIEDANRKHRDREKNEEAKFQEQMRQLREKFLFNLEDALRERDARQVLRLQSQYEMDKTALENEYALRQEQQDQQHADDIARIIRERDERLAELAQEEHIRLQREAEDFALRQQRDAEDHAREMEQIQQQIQDRLMAFAEAIGEEYNLNEEGVNALYNLLNEYYGPGGKFDDLYNYSASSIVANAQGIIDTLNQLIGQAQAISALSASYVPTISASAGLQQFQEPYYYAGGYAQGGTVLANRPTMALFGEAGPEIASFIPTRKLSASPGAVGSGGGKQGAGGSLRLMLELSPDLEARIVDTSLNEVSTVIRTIERQR